MLVIKNKLIPDAYIATLISILEIKYIEDVQRTQRDHGKNETKKLD